MNTAINSLSESAPIIAGAEQLAASLLQAARDMVPTLRERASECEALGKLPEATVEDFQRAGFFRICQPARWGGFELDPQVFFDVQMTLAEGCMSSAWVLGVVAIHNWQLALFDDRAAAEVWSDDDSVLISSSYMPVGKVTRVEGGFQLSGRWGFSSGSKHCQWAFLGAVCPPLDSSDPPDMRTFLVPLADYTIEENWDVMGLQGTGSHDIIVNDAFVPEYRTHKALDGLNCSSPGNQVNEAALFQIPFGQIFVRAVSSSSIGALQGAIDCYRQVMGVRVGINDGKRAAEDPVAQQALADAAIVVDQQKLVLHRNFDRMMEAVRSNQPLTMDERVKMRYDSAAVSDACVSAMDNLLGCCGASGMFLSHPLNRYFRDLHSGRGHVANTPGKYGRNHGAVMLGLENGDFFL
ncbi:flavin-dependent monooxygenase [Halieaceae bacterium IMCC14734]|uniref:Flavin-dependent monooxygenase n=1 Tax=Candidatus Litorirhabdus singularis TaxID=2518993 RepID=A0ABT3THW4_9GAMM|nr:flavin-dependent monooxygenase [Candidatus Litorirhabdus singularis]MCX2981864.1 flavin-dependent monooxygenase [Candidatus Litorirhabdus singularis]